MSAVPGPASGCEPWLRPLPGDAQQSPGYLVDAPVAIRPRGAIPGLVPFSAGIEGEASSIGSFALMFAHFVQNAILLAADFTVS